MVQIIRKRVTDILCVLNIARASVSTEGARNSVKPNQRISFWKKTVNLKFVAVCISEGT